jgi:hypothetical protein
MLLVLMLELGHILLMLVEVE